MIRKRWNYGVLPPVLVRYIGSVSILGPVASISMALILWHPLSAAQWLTSIVLIGLAIIAERFPLHLTHKTNVNVATAVYVAMFLLLPLAICPLLAVIAAASALFMRMRSRDDMGLAEPLFNIGQTALYVSAAALAALVAAGVHLDRVHLGTIPVMITVIVSIAMHLGNTGLVAGAAARHLGSSALRVWRTNITLDLGPVMAMSLMGICGAALGAETPLLIPALFVPAVLIHRAVSQSVRLRENMFESLAAMVEIVELRDPYTAGHSRRVAETARLIALHLGMTDEEADVVESAGRVHDIGKVAIDPAILTKASVLTDVEWTEMRLHPVLGAEVIGKFESYRSGVALVRSHHEAWDGSGYPDQLRGDAIPMGARILAVADTFDALTSDRPYREGKPVRDAIAILNNPNQQQWDPTVVRALIDLLGDDHTIVPVDQPVERLAAQPFLATAS